jgi:hypothetical protein
MFFCKFKSYSDLCSLKSNQIFIVCIETPVVAFIKVQPDKIYLLFFHPMMLHNIVALLNFSELCEDTIDSSKGNVCLISHSNKMRTGCMGHDLYT